MVRTGGGGSSPPPPSSLDPASQVEPTAVIITVSSTEAECSEGKDGELKACMVEQQPEVKCAAGVPGPPERVVGVVVDVSCSGGNPAESDGEKFCRICHLSSDQHRQGSGDPELIQLGCECKGQLGIAHRQCAQAWFRLRGNRYCEICGVSVKNIIGEEDSRFMEEWHERRMLGSSSNRNSSARDGCWRGQPFCNFLMAFLVIAFVLSWFFRLDFF